MTLPRLSRLALATVDAEVATLQERACADRPTGRRSDACTCATGRCHRTGHVPQYAACGHPGIAGHVRHLTHCHREECRSAAQIAVTILALTRRPGR